MPHSRRRFFALAAGGLLAAQNRPKEGMIVRSTRPEDLEMPLSGFSDYITPVEHFFVRTHVYVPTVNLNDWRLQVDGEVATALTLTMDELRSLPPIEMVAVAECAGNGRGLYDPMVPGLQWISGSVGNGRWRGVRLADVLKRAGVKPSAVAVLFDGADEPLGTMQDFRRSITVKKALDPNTLLAYEMNGQALPLKHGFPLRVVAPGWASDSWVKWLTSITVLNKEWDGFWMKNAYRKPDHPVAPGTALTPDQMAPVTSLQVKSVITSPVDGVVVPPETPITVMRSGAAAASAPSRPPAPEPSTAFKNACLTCHEDDVIRQQRLTRAQWNRELNKMSGWGAQVSPDLRESFLDYLSTNFGPRR